MLSTLMRLVIAIPFAFYGSCSWAVTDPCRDSPQQPSLHTGETLRVASLNIAHGRGQALNQVLVSADRTRDNLDKAALLLADRAADIVALQEADDASRWSGGFNHVVRLSEQGGYACYLHGIHAASFLFRFGTALLSRVPLREAVSHRFEPTPPSTTKGFVSGVLAWETAGMGLRLQLMSVHLDFSRRSARQAQIERILESVRKRDKPLVIMGDFNAQWSQQGSAVQRLVDEGGLVAWEPDSVLLATYREKRLDWILISPELEFVAYEVLDEAVSDHRLVKANIRWLGGHKK